MKNEISISLVIGLFFSSEKIRTGRILEHTEIGEGGETSLDGVNENRNVIDVVAIHTQRRKVFEKWKSLFADQEVVVENKVLEVHKVLEV